MKMAHSRYLSITTPFPSYLDGEMIDEDITSRFNPLVMCKRLQLSINDARRLAGVASTWYNLLSSLPFDDVMTHRLRLCTMKYSHWDNTTYIKDGEVKKYERKARTCGRAKICPWCRGKIVLDLYAKLSVAASRGVLKYLRVEGDVEDRKKLSRAPGKCVAAVRNVTYPESYLEPQFSAVFFMKDRKGLPGELCSKERLKVLLSEVLMWNYKVVTSHIFSDYLDLMKGTRLYSLNT